VDVETIATTGQGIHVLQSKIAESFSCGNVSSDMARCWTGSQRRRLRGKLV
jgi:hypothetical protein